MPDNVWLAINKAEYDNVQTYIKNVGISEVHTNGDNLPMYLLRASTNLKIPSPELRTIILNVLGRDDLDWSFENVDTIQECILREAFIQRDLTILRSLAGKPGLIMNKGKLTYDIACATNDRAVSNWLRAMKAGKDVQKAEKEVDTSGEILDFMYQQTSQYAAKMHDDALFAALAKSRETHTLKITAKRSAAIGSFKTSAQKVQEGSAATTVDVLGAAAAERAGRMDDATKAKSQANP